VDRNKANPHSGNCRRDGLRISRREEQGEFGTTFIESRDLGGGEGFGGCKFGGLIVDRGTCCLFFLLLLAAAATSAALATPC
jgi:hypothetical protein